VSESDQSGAGRREVAYRLLAAEYDDADFSYSESDEERAPNYVVTPTGARVNRLFVVGVLTEVESVSDDVLRARVVDPTGAFVLYAGQYQPDEQAFLESADTPTFVAVTGKARTFQPEDSDRVFTSVRPESISEVDARTRDRWLVQTAEQTIERVGRVASGRTVDQRGDQLQATLEDHDVDEGLAEGIALAIDHYGTSPAYLQAVREMALDVARLVAGERDEVDPVSVSPDTPGEADLAALATLDLTPGAGSEPAAGHESAEPAASEPSVGGGTGSGIDSATGDDSVEAAGESAEATPGETDEDDIGDFEPGEFDLDEDEREEIEEEFGTDFQSGTEVDDPGEADIDTPDPDEQPGATPDEQPGATPDEQPGATPDETGREVQPDPTTGTSTEQSATTPDTGTQPPEQPEGEPAEPSTDGQAGDAATDEESPEEESPGEPTAEEEPSEDVDLEDAAVDVMGELDEGGGAERDDVIETVADRHGASPDDVEDAIQDALMDGRCYEPDETTLKPI
jgi:RPA family protein